MLDNLDYTLENKHERVILHTDSATGLRAVIALHSTVRGPALAGIRLWSYSNSKAVIRDALLLSEAMTKKAVVAGYLSVAARLLYSTMKWARIQKFAQLNLARLAVSLRT